MSVLSPCVNRSIAPISLYVALIGQWRYSFQTDNLTDNNADCRTSLLAGARTE